MKYCSLDLELTGFDPLTDEILEVGLVFFEPTDQGLKVTEKYSQLFRPGRLVHPKILGLTGLKQDELDQAPQLSEHHQVIQDKIRDCIIVGHNIVLDARFLEAFGFQLSGQFIDTLDLAQFLLPTHHSYNLENLMHYFGIPHDEAHRALADCLAVVGLLESFISLYQSFPEQLRQEMQRLSLKQGFLWQKLFDLPLAKLAYKVSPDEPSPQTVISVAPVASGQVILDDFTAITPEPLAQSLASSDNKHLLVVPTKASVLELWRQGLVFGLFKPEDRFDQKKFDRLLNQHNLTKEQSLFVLKVLVWLHTNWQTETIIDLNLSFFGGQFRYLINNLPLSANDTGLTVACDYETFALLTEQKLLTDHTPVLWTAHSMEQWLGQGSQGRLTWNQTLYFLRSVYNPETDFGQQDLKEEVMAALAATDLFFGLVNLSMARHYATWRYISYEALAEDTILFKKIKTAAANFISKLRQLTDQADLPDLEKLASKLENFFVPTKDHVKWIEVTESNCMFLDQPLHIAPLLQKMLHSYPQPLLVENIPDRNLLRYTLQRLGLANLEVMQPTQTIKQSKTEVKILAAQPTEEDIMHLISGSSLPAVVLLPTKGEVRAFYDSHYSDLKQFATVWAESYSGGSNKILRNFSLKNNSLLLATPKFILRNERQIQAQTLIIVDLPKVEEEHPYLKALRQFWQHDFPGFVDQQNLAQLYLLLQTFDQASLKHLYVYPGTVNFDLALQNLPLLGKI